MDQPDDECVRLCLLGQPEMFRHLVVRYEVPLVRYLAGRLQDKDEAAEAAQEAMVRAYTALRTLRNGEAFYPWLLGIGNRVAKEMQRTRRRRARTLEAELAVGREAPAPEQERPSDAELGRAVADLPERHRQAVLMRFYGGQSCAEIGRNLGLPVGTVTSLLSRAYALLRKALREKSPNHEDVEVEP